MNEDDFLTTDQLAEKLSVTKRTLSRWHAMRIGPARTKCGHFIGYRLEAITQWMKSNETQPQR